MRTTTFVDKKEAHNDIKGGLYYRAFDLIKFMDRCEEQGFHITGINFEKDDNNIKFLYTKKGK